MKTLKEYVSESLLDDEDDILNTSDDIMLSNELNELDKIANNDYKNTTSPIVTINLTNNHDNIEIHDKKLFVNGDGRSIFNLKSLESYKSDLDTITCVKCEFPEFEKNNFLKEINASAFYIGKKSYTRQISDPCCINNLNINLYSGNDYKKKYNISPTSYIPNPEFFINSITPKISNCNIQFKDNIDNYYKNITFYGAADLPIIENIESNVRVIKIVSNQNGIFKNKNALKQLSKIIIPKEFSYKDKSKGIKTIQIKTIRDLIKIASQPNKYIRYYCDKEGHSLLDYNVFDAHLNKDVNLSEVFPYIKSLKDLTRIIITDTKKNIEFVKNDKNRISTKDGWALRLYS